MATIRDIAEVLIKVDDKEAKGKMVNLEKEADKLKDKFDKCFADNNKEGLKEAEKELRKVYRQMDSLQKRTMDVDDAMQHLSTATPKELRRVMAQLNKEINSGAIERGSKEWDDYCEKLKKVKEELKKISDEQKLVTDSGMSFQDIVDIGGNLSLMATSFLDIKDSVADFMRENIESYVALDAELANVQKFTGMTRQSVEELNEEFKDIDTRTSVVELNKLAEEAGRLGKTSKEDVLGFVKAADIINVALDDLGEGATLEISKLTNIFGDEKALGTEKSMLAVGSVINELSQNCTAAAPYLANFTKRLAGVGAQAEMTIPQIMGFAAVLDSQGQAVEMSATAVSQLITKLFQDPAKIAKATGMDLKEFTAILKEDANEALLVLLERLHTMGNIEALAPIFKDMGTDGARASAVLAALAGNIEQVRQQQEVATQAYNEATSVVKEFTVQNETEEAKLEKKLKKLEEIKVELGEKLLPVMSAFTSTGTMMIKTINALLEIFDRYKVTILTTGTAVLIYTGYVKAKNILTVKEITLEKAKILLQQKSLALLNKLKIAMAKNPWTAALVVLAAVVAIFIDYNRRLDKVAEGEKALGKIRDDAKQKVGEEEAKLKALIKTAEDEKASLENRKKAIDALNKIIPGYNGQLDETTGQYKANKKALDEYLKSLSKKYEIEGAKEMLAEMGAEKARLTTEKAEIEGEIANLQERQRRIAGADKGQAYGTAGMTMSQYSGVSNEPLLASKKGELKDISKELDAIAEKEKRIFGAYGEELSNSYAEGVKTEKNYGGGSGGGSTPDDDYKTEIALAEQAAMERWQRQRAIEDAAYSRGELSYQEHIEKLHLAELQYLNDCKAIYEQRNITEENGYKQLLEREKQLLEKHDMQLLNLTLEDLEKQKKTEVNAVLENCYDINSSLYGNEELKNQRLFEINVDYLRKKAALYRNAAMSKEAHQIEQQIEQAESEEKLRKQKEYQDRLKQWREQYAKSSPETQMKAELAVLDEMHNAGLVKEEEYQKLKKAIQDKYTSGGKYSDGGYGDMITNMYTSMDSLMSSSTDKSISGMQKIGAVAQSTWAIAGSALQQYSAYSQACCDLEVAKVESKYDRLIAAAGKNSAQAKKLEEKKEKEIAKVKNKYNKQAQKIEIAQAVAQTAMAAINAYASAAAVPIVGHILAPIAAAMAVAAGMLQIATIRKQHAAQQQGYYSGGYTRRSLNDREEVGVVHANEFVANAQATRNPALMPLLSLIDYAQRNNTVGSLTTDDVYRTLGSGAVMRSATVNDEMNSRQLVAVAGSIDNNTRVVQKLNERLNNGIEAFMVMDGERGFDRKYTEYNKLRNNTRR